MEMLRSMLHPRTKYLLENVDTLLESL